ncbi:MAG: hypothetical protein HY717_10740 [Planctomycetes bacterium]|nr:hypothetical protein [Planctomycetota bacterium]
MKMAWLLICGLALSFALAAAAGQESGRDEKTEKKEKAEERYIKVEIRGILRHGLVAIGGETTGTQITAKEVTWELELGKRKDFIELAKKLDGKIARVTGALEVKKGVEIPQRWIVTVASLKAGDDKEKQKEKGGSHEG